MRRFAAVLALTALIAGCASQQSSFAPSGTEAGQISRLFWVMTVSGGILFVFVIAAVSVAIFGSDKARTILSTQRQIIALGIIMPSVLLSALLAWGVSLMGANARPAGDTPLTVEISGEQWWWRVTYVLQDGRRIEAANELHLPVGEAVTLKLMTTDVIHSFWAPQLAGKLDMIPGRTNTMQITATSPGTSRGQCAEYCGGAHAFMSFHVVAHGPQEFVQWLEHEAGDAAADQSAGAGIFDASGCGGCHTVRGTDARGTIGPDLTHVGSRRSLAAATLDNDAEAFAAWIVNNQHIKPGNKMPAYRILSDEQVADLSAYLDNLE